MSTMRSKKYFSRNANNLNCFPHSFYSSILLLCDNYLTVCAISQKALRRNFWGKSWYWKHFHEISRKNDFSAII